MEILYEDNYIIVVVKPQNIPTQEDESKDKDMLTLIKEYIKEKYNKPNNVYLGLVHRLDRPTGGVMVFAKTSKAASRLGEQMKSGDFNKKYLAVTDNVPRENRTHLVNFLKKNMKDNIVQVVPELTTGAKKAELDYNVIESANNKTLVDVTLTTGRSHQIRVQLKNIGCPIVGDAKYGQMIKGQNLALWAYYLQFVHPTTQKIMTFKVEPPVEKMPWKLFNWNKFNA